MLKYLRKIAAMTLIMNLVVILGIKNKNKNFK